MVMFIVCVGLVVDVGHAMLVQRQLQAGSDAAALAAAYELPNQANAVSVGAQFSPTPGMKNGVNTVNNATTNVKVVCMAGVPGCNRRDGGVNAVVVQSQSKVPTWFGRVIGLNTLTVNAKATACAPCVVKPLDIMIVLDRTGSMCYHYNLSGGQVDDHPGCIDMQNARDGIKTLVQLLDPAIDKVGLALTPPALDQSWVSNCAQHSGYKGYEPWSGTPNPNVASGPLRNIDGQYFGYDAYWPYWVTWGTRTPSRYVVASLEGADGTPADDYMVNDPVLGWILNPLSAFNQRLDCAAAAGGTSYAPALAEAQHELDTNGRGNVQDVIIFISDGGANTWPKNIFTGPGSDPSVSWMNSWSVGQNPCGSAVTEANSYIKPKGTVVYTIGYDLDGVNPGQYEPCRRPDQTTGHQTGSTNEPDGYTAYTAMQAIATDPDGAGSAPPNFYNHPNPTSLNAVFTQIALDLAASRGRLIDNTNPNLIGGP
jgi:Flp pilus assembly protein TadG